MTVDQQELLGQLRAAIADFESLVTRRATEIAGPRIEAAEREAHRQVAMIESQASIRAGQDAAVIAELRRCLAVQERIHRRAAAALRASGAPTYARDLGQVPGEPAATDPAGQILRWLGQLMPDWPADEVLGMAGYCFRRRLDAQTADDVHTHPTPFSRTMPVGALIRALQVVALHDPTAAAADVVVAVRNVLLGHGVDEQAAHRQQEDETLGATGTIDALGGRHG